MDSPPPFLKAGHLPTLLSGFLFFGFCFAVWAINGAMAPFMKEALHLSPQQVALIVAVPTMSGAFLRFPFALLAQYWGRRLTALTMMACLMATLVYGYLFANTYGRVMTVGILLGIAGANFGVGLALGAGWYPARCKGFAMGIVGSGNSGTALAALFAPMLTLHAGWQAVYGVAALVMLVPLVVTFFFAKEPPDRAGAHSLGDHIQCLWQRDGWALIGFYTITFGCYVGFSVFLATFYVEQFHFTKIQTTYVLALGAFTAGGSRMVSGYLSDRLGGITTLSAGYLGLIVGFLALSAVPSATLATVVVMGCYASFGCGNGAIFQLVPLRWPTTVTVAGGAIGGVGAMGAAILPLMMGYSKLHTSRYTAGFIAFAVLVALVLAALRWIGRSWTREWVGPGGRVMPPASPAVFDAPMAEVVVNYPH